MWYFSKHIFSRFSRRRKRDNSGAKELSFQQFEVFIDIKSNCMYTNRCVSLLKGQTPDFVCCGASGSVEQGRLKAAGLFTGGVSKWLPNVPISPRSCTAPRSTASAREWLPPTAARFWPAAVRRAALSSPTKEDESARETLEQQPQGRRELMEFLRPY